MRATRLLSMRPTRALRLGQDMPPTGGYDPVQYKVRPSKRPSASHEDMAEQDLMLTNRSFSAISLPEATDQCGISLVSAE